MMQPEDNMISGFTNCTGLNVVAFAVDWSDEGMKTLVWYFVNERPNREDQLAYVRGKDGVQAKQACPNIVS